MGASWRFDEALNHSEDSSTLNTSFIERLNLTIRQGSAYLARRALSHARLRDKLEQHLELLRCHYNFVRPHRALKFGHETRTPAMQAGLTTRRLTPREVFVCTRTSASILIEYDVITFGCARRQATDTSIQMPVAALPWCTTPIEADSSLGPDSHHPIISLSGIPSAVMVLRILHPIFASTLCAANPLARIAEPTIAL